MQVLASFQFMPLPGAMFGNAADKAFRVSPRWLVVAPDQGVLEPGDSIDIRLQLHVVGGPDGCAQTLATAEVHPSLPTTRAAAGQQESLCQRYGGLASGGFSHSGRDQRRVLRG